LRPSPLLFVLASVLFWSIVVFLMIGAIVAPCGLAPGAWCELEGPNRLGATLAALGPVGVLAAGSASYAAGVWLPFRARQ